MKIEKDINVCVLIVTYNRKDYLIKTINSIVSQSIKPQKILIFDNNSTDGTEKMLKDNKIIKRISVNKLEKSEFNGIEILYYRNAENEGGSGGFSKGIKLASEQKSKYIWTMDDDVLPDIDCMKNLLLALKGRRIVIPNRTDEFYKDNAIVSVNMRNPFKYNILKRKKILLSSQIKKNVIDVVDMPFEGPMFESSLVNEVGLPNKDLFIIFDDSEYAYKISKVAKIGFVKNAILHKQIIPSNSFNGIMGWKEYYGYRNQYWFDRTYGENIFVKKLRPLFNHLDLCFRAIVKRRWSNLKVFRAAYYDGTHNILGKRVNPGKEFEWSRHK